MQTRYKILVIILLCGVIASCKKVINLDLGNSAPQLVIEGNLTDKFGSQAITISKSVAFDSTNNFPKVTGAKVKITDNLGGSYNLVESPVGTYNVNSYYGKYMHVYTLQVQLNGKTYTAVSTMPSPVNMDSLSLNVQSFANTDTKTVVVYYHDPPGVPNQYRFIMSVNNVQVKQIFVRNDQFSDGRQVQALLYQNDITLKSGDRVDIEMQCIDPVIYNYWYTFSQQNNDGPNGSATPTNPTSNFDNNVLGYFSAHTTQRRSFLVH